MHAVLSLFSWGGGRWGVLHSNSVIIRVVIGPSIEGYVMKSSEPYAGGVNCYCMYAPRH